MLIIPWPIGFPASDCSSGPGDRSKAAPQYPSASASRDAPVRTNVRRRLGTLLARRWGELGDRAFQQQCVDECLGEVAAHLVLVDVEFF
jgi:hypothetical protein